MNDNTTLNGIIGTVISSSGFFVSILPEIDATIRTFGAFVSVIAGVLTCIYMFKKIKNFK